MTKAFRAPRALKGLREAKVRLDRKDNKGRREMLGHRGRKDKGRMRVLLGRKALLAQPVQQRQTAFMS